jgi:hypothetical protein
MVTLTVTFHCSHCGEQLGSDVDDTVTFIKDNSFHDCFGERVGPIGYIKEDEVGAKTGIELQVNVVEEV